MSQWIKPKDKRHPQGFAEAVAAILQLIQCIPIYLQNIQITDKYEDTWARLIQVHIECQLYSKEL